MKQRGLVQAHVFQVGLPDEAHASLSCQDLVGNPGAGVAAGVVVFPALTGLGPLMAGAPGESPRWEEAEETYNLWGKALARDTGLFVCPGTFLKRAAGGFEHLAYLFDPSGEVVLRQGQTHQGGLLPEGLGELQAWNSIEVYSAADAETIPGDWGSDLTFGFAIGPDAAIPEVGRILALQGVDIVISPQARPAPYSLLDQVQGLWQVTQQNQFFSLESCLVGSAVAMDTASIGGATGTGRDLELEGRSTVFGPCEITEANSGFVGALSGLGSLHLDVADQFVDLSRLAASRGTSGQGLVSAVLDLDALDRIRRQYNILHFLNPPVYKEFMPRIYRGREGEGNE